MLFVCALLMILIIFRSGLNILITEKVLVTFWMMVVLSLF